MAEPAVGQQSGMRAKTTTSVLGIILVPAAAGNIKRPYLTMFVESYAVIVMPPQFEKRSKLFLSSVSVSKYS